MKAKGSFYHHRRLVLSLVAEAFLYAFCVLLWWPERAFRRLMARGASAPIDLSNLNLVDPTDPRIISEPWPYYQMLRDQQPVFRPKKQNFHCISRFTDIQEVARNTTDYSSNIVTQVLDPRLARMIGHQAPSPGASSQTNAGVTPVDVLAIQDPPAHKYQKLLTHKIVSKDFVSALEPSVKQLAADLIDPALKQGNFEFMAAVAWKLPMLMAMKLVDYPEADYEQVKNGCAQAVKILSGTLTSAQYAQCSADTLKFFRYCWKRYLITKENPGDDIASQLAQAASDPNHPITDEEAVSTIFQLLIAGSDSSASTMGNALKRLIESPELTQELTENPSRISLFIEEIFRLESAFQGHFRVLNNDVELHNVSLKKGDRVFLLWASGNRDERFWENPNEIDLERPNIKRHLTFGYGLHACLGRELARMEIRIVLEHLLASEFDFNIAGATPHVASLFSRTLLQLPIQANAKSLKMAA